VALVKTLVKRIPRKQILENFKEKIEHREPIIGCGAGTGISAKMAEKGGADLIIIYNSGRYRMAGRGSLAGLMPYGDANQIVVEMASEVITIVEHIPVLAGVCGTDPFRDMEVFLKQLTEINFSGVQNFPTVGLIDGVFRANLEATGMGYDKEVEMIRLAHKMDFLTTPYVFDEKQAVSMTKAGADILVSHVGLTTSGTIGAAVALTLDDAIKMVIKNKNAAKKVNEDVIILCHGGPFDEPESVTKALPRMPGVAGFFGASSIERLPTERAITEQVRKFKSIRTVPE